PERVLVVRRAVAIPLVVPARGCVGDDVAGRGTGLVLESCSGLHFFFLLVWDQVGGCLPGDSGRDLRDAEYAVHILLELEVPALVLGEPSPPVRPRLPAVHGDGADEPRLPHAAYNVRVPHGQVQGHAPDV